MTAQPAPLRLPGANGVRLATDAFGAPGAPPVLLFHGGGQTRHAWGNTARALAARGFRAVAVDLRGHGQSDWAPDGDYTTEAFTKDVLAAARAVGGRPALVGASLGGIACLLAEGERQPGIASAVVLVDVAPRLEPEGVERIISFMTASPDGFESLEAAADAIATYLPHRERPRDLSGLEKNLRRGDDGRYRWHWDPRFMAGPREPRSTRDPERLLRAARALRPPTLLVRGRLSDLLSEAGAREFLDAVPHARFRDVSGAGHMVAGDRNDAFSEAVIGFLESARDG